MGFEINPYDPCVANKIVDGSKCSITWYVDDIKVSLAKQTVVDEVLETIVKQFDGLTITKEDEHEYLGMKIKYNKNGTVTIDMKEFVKETIGSFGEDTSHGASTRAKNNLFDINENPPTLSEERSKLFHYCVTKLLYASTRCRLDIQLTISFLYTRVSCSTEQD